MIKINGEELKVEHYPDGTQRLNVEPRFLNCIEWRYENEEELSTLIYITKHLKNSNCKNINLYMPYIPNSRMDRTKDKEEVFTLKYFADVINWLEFDRVFVLDVHSDVSKCLINKCEFNNPLQYIEDTLEIISEGNMLNVDLYYPGDSVGDFSPLSNLTKTEVKEIGRELGLPKNLIEKVPTDGLCGKTDEENFGFSYEVLDKYIRTGEIDDVEVKGKIDSLHKKNLFKLKMMPAYELKSRFHLEKGEIIS